MVETVELIACHVFHVAVICIDRPITETAWAVSDDFGVISGAESASEHAEITGT